MTSAPRTARGVLVAVLAAVSACGTAPAPTAAPSVSSAASATAEKALTEASAEPSAVAPVDPSLVPEPPASAAPGAEPTAPAVAPPVDSPYTRLLSRLNQTTPGTVWASCAEHPATAGSSAEAWCDTANPALALKVIYNSYDDLAALDASLSGLYQQATGDPIRGGCDGGGRAREGRGIDTEVVCGFVVDEGTTYYTLAWYAQGKQIRGQVFDPDPELVLKWWYDNTPF